MVKLTPIIAIVIPTYNRRKLVTEAIQSCLTLSNSGEFQLQIVVVDDGSTDGTLESLIDEYSLREESGVWKWRNLTLLIFPNGERGLARNRGAEFVIRSLGADWILFLDADDCLDRAGIKLLIPFLNDCDLVASRYAVWFGGSEFGSTYPIAFPQNDQTPWYFLEHDCIPLGGTLISIEFFQRMKGFCTDRELSGSEDKVFLLQCALWGKIVFAPVVTVWYRQHENNTPLNRISRSMRKSIQLLEKDIVRRFSHRSNEAIQAYSRHVAYLLLGAHINERKDGRPLYMWVNIAKHDLFVVFSTRYWRYFVSIIFLKIRDFKYALGRWRHYFGAAKGSLSQ